jgi:hypothetical protein
MKKFMILAASGLWEYKIFGWLLTVLYFLGVIFAGLNPDSIIQSYSAHIVLFSR